MFAVLFSAVVLELLASMGTFGALAAQNLFTNSAAGWYVRLDWTAVYTYAVSMLSVIVSFSLALGGLTRSAPPGKRCCSLLFSPLAIFVTAFVFSILWVVIVGSAYRNPLPMKYPCDIFRHLRGSLQMLGLVSGRSLIDEGGLLVGICQSSKAFLVLAGLGMSLWILILVSSCAAIATGLDSPKKGAPPASSRSSVRTALSRLRRRGQTPGQLPMPATYPAPAMPPHPAQGPPPPPPPAPLPPAVTHDASGQAAGQARQPGPPSMGGRQCAVHCPYHKPPSPRDHPRDTRGHAAASGAQEGNTRSAPIHSAFAADGYSRDISPRPAQRTATHEYQPHSPRRTPDRQIDDNGDPDPASDSAHDLAQEHEDNVQYRALYVPDNGAACCAPYGQHYEVHRHSPTSQSSRRQRLRQMFGRDADQNE